MSGTSPTLAQARDTLKACHERRLDREGVPMVLAFVDERGRAVAPQNAVARAEGSTYAGLLRRYAELLTPEPHFDPANEATLITCLQVLSYASFEPATLAAHGGAA